MSPARNQSSLNTLSWLKRFELAWLNAWQRQAWWLWFFLPLSWLYGGVIRLRRWLYAVGLKQTYRAPVPVLVVGNITVGGSGKTPLITELVRYLSEQGICVGVISRGYGGDTNLMPTMVTTSSHPNVVGDEPAMLARQFNQFAQARLNRDNNIALCVCPDRKLAIDCLLSHQPQTQLIIADDGLQHYRLHRDIEWVVIDSERGFGNRQLLPTGFLREPLSRLDGVTVVEHQVVQKNSLPDWQGSEENTLCMHLEPQALYPLYRNPEAEITPLQSGQTVFAVSGIGYPKRFFNTLSTLGFVVIELPMPDHHVFTADDLLSLTEHPIVVTEKDAIKIYPLMDSTEALKALEIWVLPVRAVLSQKVYDKLDSELNCLIY